MPWCAAVAQRRLAPEREILAVRNTQRRKQLPMLLSQQCRHLPILRKTRLRRHKL
eukprot:CAMPEP_0180264046 /NCGR_PEP_ID=MMETSP0987-20121128/45613_1 /TAXON_ID=697907 /ORGANISM="non described non described, Strain CCMP2293" /LENGTH=54 /DNA_ID=CAMNT_0022234331 /DNA_START=29 /DNA_END=189 /DNA_ORIENTATION=+